MSFEAQNSFEEKANKKELENHDHLLIQEEDHIIEQSPTKEAKSKQVIHKEAVQHKENKKSQRIINFIDEKEEFELREIPKAKE